MNKLSVFIILLVLIFTSLFAYAYYSPDLEIKTIKLRGVKTFKENLIISFTEKYIGQNIIYLKKDKIERKLTDVKYINKAHFKRVLPNTALFTIEESVPFFRYIKDNKYYYIDKKGYIYAPDELQRKILLPVLKGFQVEQGTERLNLSQGMQRFIKNLEEYMNKEAVVPQFIEFNNQKVTLKYEGKYDIILGELENISEKFRVLKNVTDQIEQKDYPVQYVDISIYNKPVLKLKQ
ncbi:MAG TPA: cell division protein FtsQ/DivIB [Halanaerobiales bacterium]|nr:cell division protein FtsQ/DivIB [Halanaerobiales bacterium]